MATLLHLVKGPLTDVAAAAIRQQVAAGDRVTVVRLEGAPAPDLPSGVHVRRTPEELPYTALVELVFEADRVIAW
jgi:hypothetical protein